MKEGFSYSLWFTRLLFMSLIFPKSNTLAKKNFWITNKMKFYKKENQIKQLAIFKT